MADETRAQESGASNYRAPEVEPEEGIDQKMEEDNNYEKPEDYTPDERKKETLRILKWPDWALYEFLEIPEEADEDQIKKAFSAKSKLTHPDRNRDTDANEAFISKSRNPRLFPDVTKLK